MAIFELAIADEDVQRVFDAVCQNYNMPERVVNPDFDPNQEEGEANPATIQNPETQGDFVHRMVRNFLSEHVAAHEIKRAKEEAAANTSVEIDISNPQV